MKNSILVLATATLFIVGCGSGADHAHDEHGNHPEGTHTHEDGTVHEDHEESDLKQEEFIVEPDSLNQDSAKSGPQQDARSIQ